jgi:hypothetical protein
MKLPWKTKKQKELEELIQGTIRDINTIRKQNNLSPIDDLIKGEKFSFTNCPLANSLKNGHLVTIGQFIRINNTLHLHTKNTQEFVNLFDQGRISRYDVE